MFLKAKKIDISTGGPLIALLNEKDAALLDLNPLDRIEIKGKKHKIIVAVDITDKEIRKGHIGLLKETLEKFPFKNGEKLKVKIAETPRSVEFIKKKLDGKELKKSEIDEIIKDVVENELTEIELTYFVSASYKGGFTDKETEYLTKAIIKNGTKLRLKSKIIVDKHSTGGLPNNRTTMLIVPIVAAAGLIMPKTSSRAITSAAGTADVMETLCGVCFPARKVEEIVKKTNACIVWGGAMNLASADDKLIKVRHPLRLDPEGMLLSSILAKKAAVNSTHVLIDIPIGKTAKTTTLKEGKTLKRKFKFLGKSLGMKVKVMLSDGSQPIGNGVGPNLEARDVLYILMRDKRAPKDLEEKIIYMSTLILKMVGIKFAKKKVREILNLGLANAKFREIIKAQGGNPKVKPEDLKVGRYKYEVKATRSGKISSIDNKRIAKIARVAGCPESNESGLYIEIKLRQKVKRNQILFTIYSESREKLKYAKSFVKNTIKIQ
ncbi:MAG: AMP phosphorylase [Nanoarchaeota archaeon]